MVTQSAFKVLNAGHSPITLKRNTKLADVYPCVAVEDLDGDIKQSLGVTAKLHNQTLRADPSFSISNDLQRMGLKDLDIDSCEVTLDWKIKLLQL
uniref:Uncharacterized protein n=1 Tax=Denticeps clupeoides TaxID=299321 RepID=A0AAY4D4M5_9TELE